MRFKPDRASGVETTVKSKDKDALLAAYKAEDRLKLRLQKEIGSLFAQGRSAPISILRDCEKNIEDIERNLEELGYHIKGEGDSAQLDKLPEVKFPDLNAPED